MSDLYPTPTRLALLRRVAEGQIVWLAGGISRDERDGSRVTARVAEMERAGWITRDFGPWRRWKLTDTGRAVLARHGGAS